MTALLFFKTVFSDFYVFVTVAVTLGVAYVSGWTDAPNAISSCVATRCLSLKKAVVLAAVCDFSGSLVMGISAEK